MKLTWLMKVICIVTLLAILVVTFGCRNYSTPERERRRAYAVRSDMDRMSDDVDWILGLHRPVFSYDETMR